MTYYLKASNYFYMSNGPQLELQRSRLVWSPNQLLEWDQKEENDGKYNTDDHMQLLFMPIGA
jgi:hypothetical protein